MFIIPAKKKKSFKPSMERASTAAAILFATIYKYSISLSDYSGKGKGPMFGDFEAQRHWLEITNALSPKEWYFYDLQYWGLDYPPLTAYHSYILGFAARLINPEWVQLDTSRGIENTDLKLFMRLTALFTDLFMFVPAILYYNNFKGTFSALLWMILPAIQLIDHGHFQFFTFNSRYNSAMLGLALFSFVFISRDRPFVGSVLFVLALSFKQMALFYSLPVFFFLLGECFQKPFVQGYANFIQDCSLTEDWDNGNCNICCSFAALHG
jgi:alpha-1,3-glucosyltransferase